MIVLVTGQAGFGKQEVMKHEPRAMLAIDVSPFGQSLGLLPAMRSLRAAYPKSLIAVAATTGACELLAASGLVDETIDLGVIKASDESRSGAFKRLFKLVKQARKRDFDLALDFSPRIETHAISRLFVRAKTLTPSKLPHVIDMLFGSRSRRDQDGSSYANVLGQLGIKVDGAQLGVTLPDEENAQFEKLLAKRGSRGGEPVVVLHSAGAGDYGGWPVESFADVAGRFTHNFNARVIAADEPSDKAFTDALGSLLPASAIKLSEPRVLLVAAAMARASLVITDEPGVARLAADLCTPVLEITDKSQSSSLSNTHRAVAGASRARITPDEVYEVACEMLQESRSASLFRR